MLLVAQDNTFVSYLKIFFLEKTHETARRKKSVPQQTRNTDCNLSECLGDITSVCDAVVWYRWNAVNAREVVRCEGGGDDVHDGCDWRGAKDFSCKSNRWFEECPVHFCFTTIQREKEREENKSSVRTVHASISRNKDVQAQKAQGGDGSRVSKYNESIAISNDVQLKK